MLGGIFHPVSPLGQLGVLHWLIAPFSSTPQKDFPFYQPHKAMLFAIHTGNHQCLSHNLIKQLIEKHTCTHVKPRANVQDWFVWLRLCCEPVCMFVISNSWVQMAFPSAEPTQILTNIHTHTHFASLLSAFPRGANPDFLQSLRTPTACHMQEVCVMCAYVCVWVASERSSCR